MSIPQQSSSYANKHQSYVWQNFARCVKSVQIAPKAVSKSEKMLVLSVPFTAITAAIVPRMLPDPVTGFLCAAILSLALAVFVGHKLIIVQFMSKQHTYMLTGALIGTFLFGLAFALLFSEGIRMLSRYAT